MSSGVAGVIGDVFHVGGDGAGGGSGIFYQDDEPEGAGHVAGFCGGGDDCGELLVAAGAGD